MAKAAYVSPEGTARKVKTPYIGVDNTARLIIKGYIGVNGVARLWWEIDGARVVQISGGGYHSLFLNSTGNVYSCGRNTDGQLGRVVANGSATAVNLGLIPNLTNVVEVAAGSYHSLFRTSTNQVHSCGQNSSGQLGRAVANGSETTVNLGVVSGLSDITQISAGGYHSLFLDSTGNVYSCGLNTDGQLGRAVANGSATAVNLGLIPNLTDVVEVEAGSYHSLFRTSTNQVHSCGQNSSGQLGRAVANGSETTVNLGVISGLSDITQISAGEMHSLFRTSTNQVHSCGRNTSGQLGRAVANGSETTVNLGVISGLSDITQISAGRSHSLFLNLSGQVRNCGNNSLGQLGRVEVNGSETTVNLGTVRGLSDITQISAGGYHSLFLNSTGNVHSCGQNSSGQLGRAVANGGVPKVNLGEIDFTIAA